ncbi:MAG: META domain-containing protein [Ignavibacteriaceae bacterium]|nr:META domain-containing protein [Ignavibacteriaceae bacterium]
MKSYYYLFITLISIVMTFCTSSSETTINPLINDIWALEFIKGVDYQPDSSSKERPIIEIHLKENKVTGNTGCNRINGTVTVEEDQIEFSDIITTEKFCSKSIEQEFLMSLGMVNNYKVEKLKLYLYEDDQEIMIFQKID